MSQRIQVQKTKPRQLPSVGGAGLHWFRKRIVIIVRVEVGEVA